MKTAALINCRNDGYKENERFVVCINSFLETFDEVWYFDWDSPDEKGSLLWQNLNKNLVVISGITWSLLLGFNALFGFTGYIARFYAISRIPTIVFSLLSFFGVTFGYMWGILFTKDEPTKRAFAGSALIVGAIAILRYFGTY